MENKKLIIFFIDGGTWNILDPWMAEGKLPNFRRIKDGGVTGNMETTIPPSTAPAVQVFHTGKNPAKLGIFNVFKKDGSVVSFNDVKEKTFWQILGERGFRSLITETLYILIVRTVHCALKFLSGCGVSG